MVRVGVLAGLAACAAPPVAVDVTPRNAIVRLDGVPVGKGPTRFPLPYYGVAAIDATPPPPDAVADHYRPRRILVPLDPPAPLWIFPFDFFVELATAPWRPNRHEVPLMLPLTTEIAPGEVPDLEPLRQRARAAALER